MGSMQICWRQERRLLQKWSRFGNVSYGRLTSFQRARNNSWRPRIVTITTHVLVLVSRLASWRVATLRRKPYLVKDFSGNGCEKKSP
jgi:hypothetical protein